MHHTHATNSVPDAPTCHEQLSALMDGECSSQEAAELIQALAQAPGWQQTWQDFDTVGCALRAHAQVAAAPLLTPQAVFAEGVMARLQAESPSWAREPQPLAKPETVPEAANEGVFRWKLVASIATMAAVVSVAWQLGGVADPVGAQMAAAPKPAEATTVAAATTVKPVQTPQGVMLRNPELEALMAAHRQYGGMTALQMPAGFLRTATFDPSVR